MVVGLARVANRGHVKDLHPALKHSCPQKKEPRIPSLKRKTDEQQANWEIRRRTCYTSGILVETGDCH